MYRKRKGFEKKTVFILVILAVAAIFSISLSAVAGEENAGDTTLPSGTIISLNVKGEELYNVLRLIAEKAGLNIVINERVRGKVTLRLENVELFQALDALLEGTGFGYKEKDGIILVLPQEELLKERVVEVILLKYGKAEEIVDICGHFLSPSGTIQIDPRANALILADVPENMERIKEVVAKLDIESPLKERRFQLKYVGTIEIEEKNALYETLSRMVKEPESFFIDSLSNSVYVSASPSTIKKVEDYLKREDKAPKRIMIKAEFVEVRLDTLKELGINWRWEGAYEGYLLGATVGHKYESSIFSTPAAGMGIIFGTAEEALRGVINMLVTEGKANVLSSPNIVTLDGQEAKIFVGDKYPYITKTYVEEEWKETTQFYEVGATLLVTPYLREEGIIIDLQPQVNEISGAPPSPGAPPIIGVREAKTQIRVNDGETIIIGGLLRDIETETMEGTPFLSRIPFLGLFFSSKKIVRGKTDLLIFVTPYVLPETLEEQDLIEKRKSIKTRITEIYEEGLAYQKLGEYEKAKQYFEEAIENSRIYGFSDTLESVEKQLAALKTKELKTEEETKKKTNTLTLVILGIIIGCALSQ